MNEHVFVVKQNPTARAASFDVDRLYAVVYAYLVFHLVGKCLDRGGGGAAGDDEIIGDDGPLGDAKDLHVVRFLFVKQRSDMLGKLLGINGICHGCSPYMKHECGRLCGMVFP